MYWIGKDWKIGKDWIGNVSVNCARNYVMLNNFKKSKVQSKNYSICLSYFV